MVNMKLNISKKILLLMLIIAIVINSVLAFPVLPSQFYGKVRIDGQYAKAGTNISAYDTSSVLCGSFVIEKRGEYILPCKGDNPETIEDEGARENEPIIFYVNNESITPQAKWHEGGFSRLGLNIETRNKTITSTVEYPSKQRIPLNKYLLISLFLGIIVFAVINMKKQKVG